MRYLNGDFGGVEKCFNLPLYDCKEISDHIIIGSIREGRGGFNGKKRLFRELAKTSQLLNTLCLSNTTKLF